ncbi:MAG: hypothetical protein FWF08_04995 [Oscillospiraceae bacterium]|nr:hypothetical protein [Oscillospiraceae bacterium]
MKKIFISVLTVFLVLTIGGGSMAFGINQATGEECVYYSEYGAAGDGAADDFDAIIAAHADANDKGLPVCADPGAVYYIGTGRKTAEIQTNTYWGDAQFVIDDSNVSADDRGYNIFNVSSALHGQQITSVGSIAKNQEKLDLSLQYPSLIVVADNTTIRYIRYGANQNDGAPQTEAFIVDEDGNVDMNAPVIWDYDNITSMTAYPIDTDILTVSGGRFKTIANRAASEYNYYNRGLRIARSNVEVDGLYHEITGELDHGAPYNGFLTLSRCADVTVRNTMLSGHKFYRTIGSAGTSVSMGTYDISASMAVNASFIGCKQINDINDPALWGIMGSNYCKNLIYDGCELSRFDAHMGVANAAIKNSVIGRHGISIIGFGTALVENTKVYSSNFISLRDDYGSTWEGEIIIRNCEFIPAGAALSGPVLINGNGNEKHNFGYTCYMPQKITVDGLVIDDAGYSLFYGGPKLLGNFIGNTVTSFLSDMFYRLMGLLNTNIARYPYVLTEEIEISDLTVKSGKPYAVSANRWLFRNVKVTESN